MNIILKENEWAEKMIQDRSLGKKPYQTLYRVARYYLDSGYSKTTPAPCTSVNHPESQLRLRPGP